MVWQPNPGPAQVRRPFSLGKWIERLFIVIGIACTVLSAGVFVWMWTDDGRGPEVRSEPQEATQPLPRRQVAQPRTEPAPVRRQPASRDTSSAAVAPISAEPGARYVVVNDVPLRRLPDSLSRAKRVLRKDEQVEKVGSVKGWLRVRSIDPESGTETIGWARADQLRSTQ